MKILFAGTVALLCVLFTGCASNSAKALNQSSLDSAPETSAAAENSAKAVYSDNIISVSFVKKYDRPDIMKGEFFIDIRAENKLEKKITVYLQDVYLNDSTVQVGSGVPLDVLPGKSGAGTFFGKYEGTGIANADGIKKIGFKVVVMDGSASTIETTDSVEIKF